MSLVWLFGRTLFEVRNRHGFAFRDPVTWIHGVVISVLVLQLSVLAAIGIPFDWSYPSYSVANVASYQSALYGEGAGTVTIPIAPSGVVMVLNKR